MDIDESVSLLSNVYSNMRKELLLKECEIAVVLCRLAQSYNSWILEDECDKSLQNPLFFSLPLLLRDISNSMPIGADRNAVEYSSSGRPTEKCYNALVRFIESFKMPHHIGPHRLYKANKCFESIKYLSDDQQDLFVSIYKFPEDISQLLINSYGDYDGELTTGSELMLEDGTASIICEVDEEGTRVAIPKDILNELMLIVERRHSESALQLLKNVIALKSISKHESSNRGDNCFSDAVSKSKRRAEAIDKLWVNPDTWVDPVDILERGER